ncbi:MAG: N-glycosylase/DNA lyase [Bacteroidetes bacterium]|nr:N-glycosylase/DNA lyase [Bacteroidota bacterium]
MNNKFKNLNELFLEYKKKKKEIQNRLHEFKQIPKNKYFYEMVFCIMTPQSSAKSAFKAQIKFEQSNLLKRNINPLKILFSKENYIRFHNLKAKYILQLKNNFIDVENTIHSKIPQNEKREWIVKNINGLSYKEATHFLRNVGLNGELAILDRHILRCLKKYGVIKNLPKTISKKRYFEIERKFQSFSNKINIPINELDLLFWSQNTGEILK